MLPFENEIYLRCIQTPIGQDRKRTTEDKT
jgi:hypothetical protein